MNTPFSGKQFSAFWPLLVVLVTILSLQIMSLSATRKQRAQLETNIEQLSKADEDVKKVDTALGAVSKDLLALAASNEHAKQVVTEFQIRQGSEAPKEP